MGPLELRCWTSVKSHPTPAALATQLSLEAGGRTLPSEREGFREQSCAACDPSNLGRALRSRSAALPGLDIRSWRAFGAVPPSSAPHGALRPELLLQAVRLTQGRPYKA